MEKKEGEMGTEKGIKHCSYFSIETGKYWKYHSEISDTLLESNKTINFQQLERIPIRKA